MSIVFSGSGASRASWVLGTTPSAGSASASADHKSSRTISHGTGPGEATMGYASKFVVGSNDVAFNLSSLPEDVLGLHSNTEFTKIRELCISVSMPTGSTGVAESNGVVVYGFSNVSLRAGGVFHFINYTAGQEIAANEIMTFSPIGSSPVAVEMNIIGIGNRF